MKYFVTQKLSWNNINRFPHASFWWEGIDGTRVLAHFPPSNTYTAQATAGEVIRSETEHKDVERSSQALLLYGHGDGGGGPTEEMISRLERMQGVRSLPQVTLEGPAAFFRALEAEGDELLTWKGELYFELHRGTYTSQARTKYYNRRCESLLREAEMLSLINGIISSDLEGLYPGGKLEALWKDVLLNQFHDVLPGSSIEDVYRDSTKLYEQVEFQASKIRDDAMNWLFGNKVLLMHQSENDVTERQQHPPQGDANGKSIVFFNTTPFERDEVITVPYDGDEHSPQPGVLAVSGIRGFSMARFGDVRVPMEARQVSVASCEGGGAQGGGYIMENAHVRVHLDATGHIISLYDKEVARELIMEGQRGNRLMLYEDVPFFWDAWDVELYHLEKGQCVSDGPNVTLSVGMKGPLLASVVRVIPLPGQKSVVTQVISLSCLSKRVDFTCRIEWHERHQLLKVEFPVAVHSEQASFECPYGMVRRPTHQNTSWDMARFEVCAHRFADLSEPDYGVALLNDSKYGHSVRGSLMQLSLLRSPKAPDEHCDMGTHVTRFALLPHKGDVSRGRVVEEAVHFNVPLLWTAASSKLYDHRWLNQPVLQFAAANDGDEDGGHSSGPVPLAIDAIKLAEDGSGHAIIRAYEPWGCRGRAVLRVHELLSLEGVLACDLLERRRLPTEDLAVDDKGHHIIHYGPFEIVTLKARLRLGPDAKPVNPKSSISSFESISP